MSRTDYVLETDLTMLTTMSTIEPDREDPIVPSGEQNMQMSTSQFLPFRNLLPEVMGTIADDSTILMTFNSDFIRELQPWIQSFLIVPRGNRLGLGRPNRGDLENQALLDNIRLRAKDRQLEPIMTIWLGLFGGEVSFGKVDKERFQGDLEFLPPHLDDTPLWSSPLNGIKVDDYALYNSSGLVVFDLGTKDIIVPKQVGRAIAVLLNARPSDDVEEGIEIYTLEKKAEFSITFQLQGHNYNISSLTSVGNELAIKGKDVVPAGNGLPIIILGRPFLSQYFTTYNIETGEIGIALSQKERVNSCRDDQHVVHQPLNGQGSQTIAAF